MRLLTFKFLREFKKFHTPLPLSLNSALLTFLGILIYTTFSYAAQVTLEWDANTEQDLAGYMVYQGTSSRDYDVSIDVGNWTSVTIADLEDNETYCFAVKAYDTSSNKSGYSNEACTNSIYLGQIDPVQGTIGTELTINGRGFGVKKGKVTVGTSKCKVFRWTDASISCLLKKVSSTTGTGIHNLTMKPKGKGTLPMVIEDAFSIMAPDIQAVTTSGNSATITGLFFGTNKVNAYLLVDGYGKRKKLEVISLQMNPGTGVSQLEVTVSNKVLKKLEPGSYDVIVANKVGSDTFPNGLTIE